MNPVVVSEILWWGAASNVISGCWQLGCWLDRRRVVNVAIMALNFFAAFLLILVRHQ